MNKYDLPEKLQRFYSFLNNAQEEFADIELDENGMKMLTGLLGPKAATEFIPVAAHSSASLISFWLIKSKDNLEANPLVWIDSEGSPNCVFAENLNDFFSLLPYGTGFIYDVISRWESYNNYPDMYKDPAVSITSADEEEALENARMQFPGHGALISWLDKEMTLKPSGKPAKTILDAIGKHPSLPDWLRQQGIRK